MLPTFASAEISAAFFPEHPASKATNIPKIIHLTFFIYSPFFFVIFSTNSNLKYVHQKFSSN